MTCTEAAERITALVDGELPPAERAALEGHLSACPACREARAAEEAVAARLRAAPLPPLPAGFAVAVMARVGGGGAAGRVPAGRGPAGRVLPLWPLVAAASAVAAAVVAMVVVGPGAREAGPYPAKEIAVARAERPAGKEGTLSAPAPSLAPAEEASPAADGSGTPPPAAAPMPPAGPPRGGAGAPAPAEAWNLGKPDAAPAPVPAEPGAPGSGAAAEGRSGPGPTGEPVPGGGKGRAGFAGPEEEKKPGARQPGAKAEDTLRDGMRDGMEESKGDRGQEGDAAERAKSKDDRTPSVDDREEDGIPRDGSGEAKRARKDSDAPPAERPSAPASPTRLTLRYGVPALPEAQQAVEGALLANRGIATRGSPWKAPDREPGDRVLVLLVRPENLAKLRAALDRAPGLGASTLELLDRGDALPPDAARLLGAIAPGAPADLPADKKARSALPGAGPAPAPAPAPGPDAGLTAGGGSGGKGVAREAGEEAGPPPRPSPEQLRKLAEAPAPAKEGPTTAPVDSTEVLVEVRLETRPPAGAGERR